MKSWMWRLSALTLIGGAGTAGVIVLQHRGGGSQDAGPNWNQAPVNADEVAALSGTRPSGGDRYAQADGGAGGDTSHGADTATSPATRTPVDPFVGISSGGGSGDYRSGGGDQHPDSERNVNGNGVAKNGGVADGNVIPTSGDGNVDARSVAGEPRRLEADPGAAPIAPAPVSGRRSAADQLPPAGDVGLSDRRDVVTPVSDVNGSAMSQPPIVSGQNELRYVDNSARRTSSAAGATGTVEAAADDRSIPPAVASMGGGRFDNAPPGVGSPNGGDYRRAGDVNGGNTDTVGSSDSGMIRSAPMGGTESGAGGNLSAMNATGSGMPNSGGFNNGAMNGNGFSNNGFNNAGANSGGFNNEMPQAGSAVPGNSTQGAGFAVGAGAAGMMAAASSGINIEGFGKPGDKKLEGAQTPSVTIQKNAPSEIQVGKEATFEIVVRNTGPVQADEVQVTDVVPQGTRLLNTTPHTNIGPRGEIVWQAGDLKPGEEAKLQVQVMPLQEGEIGSTAVVQFRSAASMRTVATKPDLILEVGAPQQVMIGQDAKLQIKLSNPGTGAANKVVLSARIPPNFQHPAGNDLEFEVGQFKPGESRDLDLVLHAQQAGPCAIALSAQGDANLHVEKAANIEVVAPRLEVKLAGPAMRYLDRQAKYTVTVGNPGTAAAKDITLVTHLPKGLQFVEASDSGQYDSGTNTVSWGLDELPPGQSGNVTLTAQAKEAGDQKLRSEVKAASGLNDASEQLTVVEGVAAVNFTVAHLEDPVEVGGQATYEIHIVNQGSKAANRLQVMAVLPPEIKPVSGDGPSRQAIEGQRIAFEPLARLAPKAEVTYRVVGQCLAPGDLRVQVLLQTDDMAKPVVKEEGTRVYKD